MVQTRCKISEAYWIHGCLICLRRLSAAVPWPGTPCAVSLPRVPAAPRPRPAWRSTWPVPLALQPVLQAHAALVEGGRDSGLATTCVTCVYTHVKFSKAAIRNPCVDESAPRVTKPNYAIQSFKLLHTWCAALASFSASLCSFFSL